jgi:hypothetical protein
MKPTPRPRDALLDWEKTSENGQKQWKRTQETNGEPNGPRFLELVEWALTNNLSW